MARLVEDKCGHAEWLLFMACGACADDLRDRISALEEDRDNLRGLFEHAAQLSWDVGDIDGGDFQDEAERRGLMVGVPATDEIADEYDTDVMFTWAWSPLNKDGEVTQ